MSEAAIETEVDNPPVVETTVDESKNVNEELVELVSGYREWMLEIRCVLRNMLPDLA